MQSHIRNIYIQNQKEMWIFLIQLIFYILNLLFGIWNLEEEILGKLNTKDGNQKGQKVGMTRAT